MTPNKPEVEEAAQELVSPHNSAIENQMLRLVSRLAKTITYNAEAANKLVRRVDELEKLVVQQSAPKKDQKLGEYLEHLLNDESVTQVMCTYAESGAFTVGKVYPVEVDNTLGQKRHIRSNHASMFQEGIKYTRTTSRFEIWGQRRVKPVIGHELQVLLANKHVHTVKCVVARSHQWIEGKEYVVLVNTADSTQRKVKSETGKLLSMSCSLFVEVKPEPSKVTVATNQLTKEQRLHMFLEQTRVFMGLPTIHLIHPRSL